MNTILKVILTIVLTLAMGAVIAIMQEAHIFGKVFVSFIWFFLVRLIWSSGKKDNQQNQTNQSTGSNTITPPPIQPIKTISVQGGANIPTYNGGHNSNANSSQQSYQPQPNKIATQTQETPKPNTGSKEFNGSNPYSKN